METIAEAKQYLRDNWEEGVKCPCCTRMVKLYSVKLDGSMVRSLMELYKLDTTKRDNYFHVTEFDAWTKGYAGGKFAKLRHWGFTIDQDNTDPDKHASGMWRITPKGRAFVERKIRVPSHVKLFNQKFFGYDGKEIDIKDAIGTKFSYQEVMGDFYVNLPLPKELKWLKQEAMI